MGGGGVPGCTVTLCPLPLQYVENPELERWGLEPVTALQQLMSGLSHLHSLHIGRPRRPTHPLHGPAQAPPPLPHSALLCSQCIVT